LKTDVYVNVSLRDFSREGSCAHRSLLAGLISAPRQMLRKLSMTRSMKGQNRKFSHYCCGSYSVCR
jgi:hypothetical protein